MQNPAIKIVNLTKKFGKLAAVDGLSLEIAAGEIFAFLGPNGAGKTTTVKLLTGLLKPTTGSISIAGFDIVRQATEAKRVSGLVTDQPFVYSHVTGFEFLRFVGDLYGVDLREQQAKIPELLAMFELSEWAHELTASYSHGMKQKLVLAGVLLHKPKVLFLDEPLVGLDPRSARLVKEIFGALSRRGATIFICTHVLEIAERLAHRVGIIQQGKMIALESVPALKARLNSAGNLEDIFLHLTGGTEYAEMLKYL